ncbi:MAG TPA: hypothetical protein VEC37_13300 [Bacillota bacterium]|nr:hypothetical protein [Bacillota bacterium]
MDKADLSGDALNFFDDGNISNAQAQTAEIIPEYPVEYRLED